MILSSSLCLCSLVGSVSAFVQPLSSPPLLTKKQPLQSRTSFDESSLLHHDTILPTEQDEVDFLHLLFQSNNIFPSASSSLLKKNTQRSLTAKGANSEYDLKLGKAMDTLRKDYPDLLISNPDFSIYSNDIQVIDPSGFKIQSLQNYKSYFSVLHMVSKWFYKIDSSQITYKLAYDCARKVIRVSWHAYLIPRSIVKEQYFDGISVYKLDSKTGLIQEHKVERLLLNNEQIPMMSLAELGEFAVVGNTDASRGGDSVVAANGREEEPFYSRNGVGFGNTSVGSSSSRMRRQTSPTVLFAKSSDNDNEFDQTAYDRKNELRRKFGLKPLTPDEYIQLELQVQELELEQLEKQEHVTKTSSSSTTFPTSKKRNIFQSFLNIDTCEDNYDCERPQVCCDLGIKKICCASGMKVFDGIQYQQQMIPVPAIAGRGQPEPDIGSNGETPW